MSNLINVWKKRNQILEGARNRIFKQEHVEAIAQHRLAVCNTCEFIDRSGERCYVIGTQPCCSACGCSLALKTRALSDQCPNEFWGAVTSREEEDAIKESVKENQSL